MSDLSHSLNMAGSLLSTFERVSLSYIFRDKMWKHTVMKRRLLCIYGIHPLSVICFWDSYPWWLHIYSRALPYFFTRMLICLTIDGRLDDWYWEQGYIFVDSMPSRGVSAHRFYNLLFYLTGWLHHQRCFHCWTNHVWTIMLWFIIDKWKGHSWYNISIGVLLENERFHAVFSSNMVIVWVFF